MIPGPRTVSFENGTLTWTFRVTVRQGDDGVHAALMCDAALYETDDPGRMIWHGPYPTEAAAIDDLKTMFKDMVDRQRVTVTQPVRRTS